MDYLIDKTEAEKMLLSEIRELTNTLSEINFSWMEAAHDSGNMEKLKKITAYSQKVDRLCELAADAADKWVSSNRQILIRDQRIFQLTDGNIDIKREQIIEQMKSELG